MLNSYSYYNRNKSHSALELQTTYSYLSPGEEDTQVRISFAGRIKSKRTFGKLMFLTVEDDSGSIQLYVEKKRLLSDGKGIRALVEFCGC